MRKWNFWILQVETNNRIWIHLLNNGAPNLPPIPDDCAGSLSSNLCQPVASLSSIPCSCAQAAGRDAFIPEEVHFRDSPASFSLFSLPSHSLIRMVSQPTSVAGLPAPPPGLSASRLNIDLWIEGTTEATAWSAMVSHCLYVYAHAHPSPAYTTRTSSQQESHWAKGAWFSEGWSMMFVCVTVCST